MTYILQMESDNMLNQSRCMPLTWMMNELTRESSRGGGVFGGGVGGGAYKQAFDQSFQIPRRTTCLTDLLLLWETNWYIDIEQIKEADSVYLQMEDKVIERVQRWRDIWYHHVLKSYQRNKSDCSHNLVIVAQRVLDQHLHNAWQWEAADIGYIIVWLIWVHIAAWVFFTVPEEVEHCRIIHLQLELGPTPAVSN